MELVRDKFIGSPDPQWVLASRNRKIFAVSVGIQTRQQELKNLEEKWCVVFLSVKWEAYGPEQSQKHKSRRKGMNIKTL